MRAAIAEFVGAFCFVFVGAGSVCALAAVGGGINLVAVALAHGAVLAALTAGLGRVSGAHFNPAVTVALTAAGRLNAGRAAAYVAVQLAGAALAALALRSVLPPEAAGEPARLGATVLGVNVSPGRGVWIEGLLTFVLVTAVYGTAVAPGGPAGFSPLAYGLAYAAGVLAGGPLTGGSMNPARSTGPAIVTGNLAALWVYWIGPLLGGMAAAWTCDCLLPAPGRGKARRK